MFVISMFHIGTFINYNLKKCISPHIASKQHWNYLSTYFKLSLSKGISITIFGIYLFFISKNCINHFSIAEVLYDNHFQFSLNYFPKYIWGSFSFFVFDQNWYGDHFPILIWGSFSDGDHFLFSHFYLWQYALWNHSYIRLLLHYFSIFSALLCCV